MKSREICCKYCKTTKNLKKGLRLGKVITYPVCDKHYKKYKEDKQLKREKTNTQKYGTPNVMQVELIKETQKNSVFKKYGVKNPNQSEVINRKREETNQFRYGGKAPIASTAIKNKIKKTSLEKYGVDNPIKNKNVKEKALNTIIKRFGVSNIFSSEIFKENMRLLNQEKYGVDYFTQTDSMKNKTKKTMLENYGVCYHSQNPEIKRKMWKTYRTNYWSTFLLTLKQKYIEPLFDKEHYIQNTDFTEFRYRCLRCNKDLIFSFMNPHRICCSCTKHRSYYEDDIIHWLNSLDILDIEPNKKFYENGKLKYEIDIYLTKYNIGIDFSGIYWHSDKYKDRNYHQNKYLYFLNKKIQFIQIFENEWVNKQDIVKSIIISKLKKNKKHFARKGIIKQIENKMGSRFFIENHLQGDAPATIFLGLFIENELMCVGSFGSYRYKNENSFELIRFATKQGITVIGGFNKLLTYFENAYKPIKLISFVDVRYFSGGSYINFINEGLTKPNYFYFKEKDKSLMVWSRIKFQKHKLHKLLKQYNPNLSEVANMKNNGYLRIFDAGNLKMVKNYNKK